MTLNVLRISSISAFARSRSFFPSRKLNPPEPFGVVPSGLTMMRSGEKSPALWFQKVQPFERFDPWKETRSGAPFSGS